MPHPPSRIAGGLPDDRRGRHRCRRARRPAVAGGGRPPPHRADHADPDGPDRAGRLRDPDAQRPAPGRGGRGRPRAPGRAARPGPGSMSSASTNPTSASCSTTCSSTRATRSRSSCSCSHASSPTIAFVLAADLAGPGVTIADALTADRRACCRRSRSWTAGSPRGGCRSPTPSPTTPRRARSSWADGSPRPPPSTCAWSGCCCYRNGVPIESAAGAAALGNPARCVGLAGERARLDRPGAAPRRHRPRRPAAPLGAGPPG